MFKIRLFFIIVFVFSLTLVFQNCQESALESGGGDPYSGVSDIPGYEDFNLFLAGTNHQFCENNNPRSLIGESKTDQQYYLLADDCQFVNQRLEANEVEVFLVSPKTLKYKNVLYYFRPRQ